MNSKPKVEGKVTKKRYEVVHRIVDIVVLLLFILYGVFRSAGVQTFLVKRVTSYLSRELKTEISISGIDISWFFNVALEDLKVNDQNHKRILNVDKLVLGVDRLGLIKHTILFSSVRLVRADIRMVRSAKDSTWNYAFLINYFSSGKVQPKTTAPSKPWNVTVKAVDLMDCRFMLQDLTSDTVSKGICFSNLRFKNVNLRVTGLRTVNDSIFGNIRDFTALEHSGFNLKEFNTVIKFSPVNIVAKKLHFISNRSDVNMDLEFKYRDFSAFNNFLDSVSINSKIRSSQINMEDIAYFAPDLMGMDDPLKLEGELSGKINNLRLKDFKFEFGKQTRFDGNITMSGLPNIYETFVHFNIKELKTSVADLRKFKLPDGKSIELVPTYDKIGSIKVKGFFTGFYNDFVSYADFKTDAGEFSTDLAVRKGAKPIYISYKGKLKGRNVEVGRLFSITENIGRLNMDLQIEGKGIDMANLDAHLTGTVDSMEFRGNKIDNIALSGAVKQKAFSGMVKIRDALINLDFNGKVDMNRKLPLFDLTASLKDAQLTKLNLISRDTSATLTAHMNLNFEGNNFDNLLGKIVFDSTLYTENGKSLPLKSLVLETKALPMGDKQVLLRSDYLDGDLTGIYKFTRFYSSLNLILNKYLPSLKLWNAIDPTDQFPQNYYYYLTIKDPDRATAIFLPNLRIASNTTIKGSFSAPDRSLIINGDAPSLVINGMRFNDFYLKGTTSKNQLFINTGATRIDFKENKNDEAASLGVDSAHFQATVAGDSIRYRLKWDDKGKIDHNKGDISGYAAFHSLSRINLGVTRGRFMVNDSLLTINPGNSISIDSSLISVDNLAFSGIHQRLLLQGSISKDPDQKLNVYFQQVDISGLDKFINVYGVDINGVADGSVSLMNLYGSPKITSNLNILGLTYNNVKLGDASIRSSWNDDEKALLVDMHVIDLSSPNNTEPLSVTGTFHPYLETDNFNFDVKLNDLQLHAINPFLDSFMSDLNGLVSGDLQFLGPTNFPYLKGVVTAKKTSFKIDYLNTRYKFEDKVTIDKDAFRFENFAVKDTLGNTAIVNGEIRNHSFNNWALDLSIAADKFLGFNKAYSYDEMYYGNAYGSGHPAVRITGPVENLVFTINAKTEKGTNIFIPLNNPGTVSENDFITFINKADTSGATANSPSSSYSGLSMNMNYEVNENAAIQLFLPYDMGSIKGTGKGLLKMDLDNYGEYSISGLYQISKGTFDFTMPKYTLKRTFDILDGSYIRWNGSPYDATINMTAAYRKDVSLSSLPNNASQLTQQQLAQRIKVNCIISLKDNLFKPKIKFSINLPDADESTKRTVFSAIDTTNEAEMNQQMISLLMVGSFSLYNENKTLASSLSSQPYELISGQLNNMLSQISSDFDIGFNYRPGDNMTTNEVELMLSKKLFNDRMRVEVNGNFPTSNNNINNTQRSSNLVGDVNIEYKLTSDGRLMLKAYNKVNRDIIDIYAPYKQGIGISWRKEFDYFKDLFRKKKKLVVTPPK